MSLFLNSLGKVWHPHLLIDTMVISRCEGDPVHLSRLVALIRRMTVSEHAGPCVIAWSSVLELLSTADPALRAAKVRALRQLVSETDRAIRFLAPVRNLIGAEWGLLLGDHVVDFERHLDDALAGMELTPTSALGEMQRDASQWQRSLQGVTHRWSHEFSPEVVGNAEFSRLVEMAIRNWSAPTAFELSAYVLDEYLQTNFPGHQFDVAKAVANPERFLRSWAYVVVLQWAVMVRSMPTDARVALFPGHPELSRPHRNDIADAEIACAAAAFGILLTEDVGFAARINHFHQRRLVRPQAFGLDVLENRWRPPR